MLKTIRQTLWALRYALRAHPILVLSSFTLLTVLSFLPSVQMLLIAAITDSLSAGDTHTALTWAGVTGGVRYPVQSYVLLIYAVLKHHEVQSQRH